MKILIVDDERLILAGLKSCIEKITDIDCSVKTALSGKQALELLEIEPVDLLISDVEMTGLSGLELIERAEKRNYSSHFIILSGYDKFEYVRTALRLGIVDYLLKPVDKEELRRNICRIAREIQQPQQPNLLQPYQDYFPHLEQEDIPVLLRKSVQFIKDNYKESVSLSMLSAHTGKTENYLCGLFKKEWNTTFMEVVNEIRLREALYMLLYEPALSVRDIAGKIGYHTERQLFRLIKGYLGMTPQQVRNQSVSPTPKNNIQNAEQ